MIKVFIHSTSDGKSLLWVVDPLASSDPGEAGWTRYRPAKKEDFTGEDPTSLVTGTVIDLTVPNSSPVEAINSASVGYVTTISSPASMHQGKDLDARLTDLEGALQQTPEKALSLPLLRQQVLDMQVANKSDIESLRGEVGRLYGFLQWLVGLMMTLLVGIGGLAITTLKHSTEKMKEKPSESSKPTEAGKAA